MFSRAVNGKHVYGISTSIVTSSCHYPNPKSREYYSKCTVLKEATLYKHFCLNVSSRGRSILSFKRLTLSYLEKLFIQSGTCPCLV